MSKGKALLASIFLLVSGVSLSSSLSANCGWGGCPGNYSYCPECDMYYENAPEHRDYRGPRFRGNADRPYWREYARENYRAMREDDGFYRDDRRDGSFRRDRRDMRDEDGVFERRENLREERRDLRDERRDAMRENVDRRAADERRKADAANK